MRERHHRRSRALLLLPLVVIAWFVVLALAVLLVASAVVLVRVALPLALLAAVAVGVASSRRSRLRAHRVPGRAVAPPPAPSAWPDVRARFARLQQEYARFECDALAVLRIPALADVSVPSTARFVDAFAEAQALDSATEPPARHRERFAAAVDRAWRAWEAARDAAERIRLTGVPQAERAAVERVIALLTLARDSGNDAERTAAYIRARAQLAGLERSGAVQLPGPAAAALADAARGQLPGGS